MNNLVETYGELGRDKEALKLQEEVLEFRQRVQPKDHPDIATSMLGLGSTYGKLGRDKEALKLHEEALECFKHVLPEDHPDIAASI